MLGAESNHGPRCSKSRPVAPANIVAGTFMPRTSSSREAQDGNSCKGPNGVSAPGSSPNAAAEIVGIMWRGVYAGGSGLRCCAKRKRAANSPMLAAHFSGTSGAQTMLHPSINSGWCPVKREWRRRGLNSAILSQTNPMGPSNDPDHTLMTFAT